MTGGQQRPKLLCPDDEGQNCCQAPVEDNAATYEKIVELLAELLAKITFEIDQIWIFGLLLWVKNVFRFLERVVN